MANVSHTSADVQWNLVAGDSYEEVERLDLIITDTDNNKIEKISLHPQGL